MLSIRLRMADGSHDGEPVTVEVDGAAEVLTIDGSWAQTVISDAAPGRHTVELTEPAGCFPIVKPTCPRP
jgi:hypothetical protein